MNNKSQHYRNVASHYDQLADHGPYGTLAPHNRGGRKGEYVGAVFDAAALPFVVDGGVTSSLLDFGCGTGIFSRTAARYVHQVVGVDVSQRMLDVAHKVCTGLANVTFYCTDGEQLPFENCSFDRIAAREVLCYVLDERLTDVLAEIYRVLKPGGRFVLLEQVSNNMHWQHHPSTPNLVKRSPAALRRFAEAAGFHIEDEIVIRTPRFPWIYPVWFGLVPHDLIPWLARYEVAWHRRFGKLTRRWWNALFVLVKPQ